MRAAISMTPRLRRNLEGYLFIAPWLIGFLAFILGPFVFSFVLALSEWSILEPPKFVGLGNFEKLLGEELFWKSLRVTTIFTVVSVLLRVSIALLLASLLNQGIRGHRFFQAGFYMPVMFSGVVLGVLWAWMFPFDYGLINDLLRRVGVTGPRWLSTPTLALTSIIIMSMWRVGGMMVIFPRRPQGHSLRTLRSRRNRRRRRHQPLLLHHHPHAHPDCALQPRHQHDPVLSSLW